MGEQMHELGQACKRAIKASGKKVVLLSSNSLSHRHFVTESDVPEDMSKETSTTIHNTYGICAW